MGSKLTNVNLTPVVGINFYYHIINELLKKYAFKIPEGM
jgi:hypothetical protein